MKRGTPRHRKLIRLADTLGVERTEAAGIVELLWHLCAEQTPQGNVGLLTNREIALGIYSTRDPDQLVDALVSTEWLDVDAQHRLIVHDWADHVDDTTAKRLRRNGLTIYRMTSRTTADNGGQRQPPSTTVEESGGQRPPFPPTQDENGGLPEARSQKPEARSQKPEAVPETGGGGQHPPPGAPPSPEAETAGAHPTPDDPLGRLRAGGWGASLQPVTIAGVELPYTPDVAAYLRRAGPCAEPAGYFVAAVAYWRSIQHDRRRGCSTDWLAMLETWASWHADRCAPCRQDARRARAAPVGDAALTLGGLALSGRGQRNVAAARRLIAKRAAAGEDAT